MSADKILRVLINMKKKKRNRNEGRGKRENNLERHSDNVDASTSLYRICTDSSAALL